VTNLSRTSKTIELSKLNPPKFSGIDFPSPDEDRPVRVVNIRYEIVSTPGQYRLAMPVLAARTDSERHTITISIETLPADVSAEVTAFYRGLTFYSDSDQGPWHYDGVMFPGQGFNIVLNPRVENPGAQSSAAKTGLRFAGS